MLHDRDRIERVGGVSQLRDGAAMVAAEHLLQCGARVRPRECQRMPELLGRRAQSRAIGVGELPVAQPEGGLGREREQAMHGPHRVTRAIGDREPAFGHRIAPREPIAIFGHVEWE